MKYLLHFVLLVLVAACGPDRQHGRLKGTITGINDAKIQVFVEGRGALIDTIDVKKGEFSADCAVDTPALVTLLYPNMTSTTLVMGPGETVKIEGNANKLSALDISGNKDNVLLTEFRNHVAGKSAADARREAATFVRSHPATLAAVVLFREFFADVEVVDYNPTAALLKELEKGQPKSTVVRQLAERLRPILATAPGQPMPPFDVVDIKGKSVRLSDYKGKTLMIVISSYQNGDLYSIKYAADDLRTKVDTTNFKMLFVTTDTDVELCKRNAVHTPLPGRVVCDGKAMASPLLDVLGRRFLPTNILVGKDGNILRRDIPQDEWSERIPRLL